MILDEKGDFAVTFNSASKNNLVKVNFKESNYVYF